MQPSKCCLAAAAAALLLLGAPPAAQGQSLWDDRASLFADHRAHAVGDILTIVISENFSASRTGKTANSKKSSADISAGTGSLLGWLTAHGYDMSDSFSATGSISNTNKVTARMTATVTEVKPNGNLVIKGTQSIKQNNDEQIINLVGTIRTDDVSADNTVLSTAMADSQIFVNGKGPIAQKQRQGILSTIFDFLF